MDFLTTNINEQTVPKMREFLKSCGSTFSLKLKVDYQKRIKVFKNVIDFPWRQDQKTVIENFMKFDKKYYCINAIFGAGKTTLLMGMLIHAIIQQLIHPSEVLFMSFNISIKNEIKRKLKDFGISSKVTVRTFDSIIYEICKNTHYKYIDLPNFEGKRKHVYELCDNNCEFQLDFQPKIIFIDECQDLEKTTLKVIEQFYPTSKVVFTGDIFQSIQKEPRESILWYLINNDIDNCYKMYMNETPRVPQKILLSLKRALTAYYPEFKTQIDNWKSANTTSNCDIEWRTLYSYSHIFDELNDFCEQYKAQESMILTFSSSITVRGQMGDISRLRRFLLNENLNVNTNHKRQEPENYFLTTANSSKGLERDYVVCFLTFPLEKAFISLSDDVVVNLITVALTRAKKKVIFYVPKYEDKYSRVLKLFDACPKPSTRITEHKGLNEFTFQNYLDSETCVTTLLKQSIIKYDTRIKLTENYAKAFKYEKIFTDGTFDFKMVPKIILEEERQFVGVLIENLITSTWSGKYPGIFDDVQNIEKNPMYNHCIDKIKKLINVYNNYSYQPVQSDWQFKAIYIYTQLHIAISDKIIMNLSKNSITALTNYWNYFKSKCLSIKPLETNMKIQARLRMPWLTGVADVIINYNENKKDDANSEQKSETVIYELKASIDIDWEKDALIQAVLYSLMTGKNYTKIILINPFRNEKIHYSYNPYLKLKDTNEKLKQLINLRDLVINDILTYNLNCMMAKMKKHSSELSSMKVCDSLFFNISENSVTIIETISPIKVNILYHEYFNNNDKENTKECVNEEINENSDEHSSKIPVDELQNLKIEKKKDHYIYKRKLESIKLREDVINIAHKLLQNNTNKNKTIYSIQNEYNYLFLKDYENTELIDIDLGNFYTKDEKLTYSLNDKDTLHQSILFIANLFLSRNFF